jgi:hypothetical protein
MPELVLETLLIGAALGMRFNVFVLVPSFGLLLIALLAVTRGGGAEVSTYFIAAALGFLGLQIGYLSGAALRFYEQLSTPRQSRIIT